MYSSGDKDPDSPNPRWPYLNRWTATCVSGSPRQIPLSPTAKSPQESQLPKPPHSNPAISLASNSSISNVSAPPSDLLSVVSVREVITAAKSTIEETREVEPIKLAPETIFAANLGKEVENKYVNHNRSIQSTSLKGAWTKKLNLSKASSSHLAPRISRADPEIWPSLSASKTGQNQQARAPLVVQKSVAVEDNVRFPWAAKTNLASRNLYRATEPKFLEDGTPKVTIPPHVLLQGLENQKEYVLGQFYRCSPPSGGLIFAVFNKLLGKNCRITIRKLGDSNYLFHIPDESTRNWVLQRGLWHVDDCLMFVAAWTPEASLAIPEIKTIPVWVTLKRIPNILYSIPGISHIASGLGALMATHKPRLDPILMGEAKILVEVELSKAFPTRIAAEDDNGFISMVDVEYAWLPSKCGRCGQLGHKVKRCLQAENAPNEVAKTVLMDAIDVLGASINVQNSEPTIVEDPIPLTTASATEKVSISTEPPTTPSNLSNNETIESPSLEAARSVPVTITTIAQAPSTVQKESERIVEPDFGSNKFGSLISLEGEEDPSDSDKESDSLDLMTPSGKRILRERPVKLSTNAKEMSWQSTGRGHGNRGGHGPHG
ncbi:hypothetical protein EUTSA_v10029505mg [Eutrema salsugineum]|uniref:CCHC-type domain-containing protein n=1 Tax=Eutrema salsugineum TaxID=72664 RepID=V4L3Q2_EUTSA|nr:hypothetical protein EUTSA_v10029505mg [Eutrema salsugineum]